MTAINAPHHEASIPISEIHDALQHEWGELSATVEEQTGALPLRTNTSTLVVIAEAGRLAARAREDPSPTRSRDSIPCDSLHPRSGVRVRLGGSLGALCDHAARN